MKVLCALACFSVCVEVRANFICQCVCEVTCVLACFIVHMEVRANFVRVSAVILSEGMAPLSGLISKGKWQKSFYHVVSLEEQSDPAAVKTSFCRLCISSCIPIMQRVSSEETPVCCAVGGHPPSPANLPFLLWYL